jgi:hypothetical protein
MNILPFESQVRVISALTEGVSIRSTERLTGVNRNTIMSLGLRVGEGCERLHDRTMRDLQVNLIELDEQWDFVAKKQRHVKDGDPDSYGDAWSSSRWRPRKRRCSAIASPVPRQHL